MKFKEQRGNTFVFDGGYAGMELELVQVELGFVFNGVWVGKDENSLILVNTISGAKHYNDIQTAVNLMQILIKEGLV